MSSYALLLRVLNDQCTVTGKTVAAKPGKEITSDSLQNPSDPDAAYDGHKGKGYQVQVMETWSGDDRKPDLITHVEVEKTHESDANALLPAIKETQKRDVMPDKRKKERNTVAFEHEHCADCPRRSTCPVKDGKKYRYPRFDDKVHRLAKRRAREKTDEFKDRYRYRAGVEATMSDYDRVTGVKQLRVRGFEAVRFCALLKAVALNIHRTSAFIKKQMRGADPVLT
jgi:hypothetical protein